MKEKCRQAGEKEEEEEKEVIVCTCLTNLELVVLGDKKSCALKQREGGGGWIICIFFYFSISAAISFQVGRQFSVLFLTNVKRAYMLVFELVVPTSCDGVGRKKAASLNLLLENVSLPNTRIFEPDSK